MPSTTGVGTPMGMFRGGNAIRQWTWPVCGASPAIASPFHTMTTGSPGLLGHDGSTVRRTIVQGSPPFPAAGLFERHHARSVPAADVQNDQILRPPGVRRRCPTPACGSDSPAFRSRCHSTWPEAASRQCSCPVLPNANARPVVERHASPRSGRVTDSAVLAGVRVDPQLSPRLLVEAQHALDFRGLGLPVHHARRDPRRRSGPQYPDPMGTDHFQAS